MRSVQPGVPLDEQGLKQCTTCNQPIDLEALKCPICKKDQPSSVSKKLKKKVESEQLDSLSLSPRAQPVNTSSKPPPIPTKPKVGKLNRAEEALSLSPRSKAPVVEGPFETVVVTASPHMIAGKAAAPPQAQKGRKGVASQDAEAAPAPAHSGRKGVFSFGSGSGGEGTSLKSLFSSSSSSSSSKKKDEPSEAEAPDAGAPTSPHSKSLFSRKKETEPDSELHASAGETISSPRRSIFSWKKDDAKKEDPAPPVQPPPPKKPSFLATLTKKDAAATPAAPAAESSPLQRDTEQAKLVAAAIKAKDEREKVAPPQQGPTRGLSLSTLTQRMVKKDKPQQQQQQQQRTGPSLWQDLRAKWSGPEHRKSESVIKAELLQEAESDNAVCLECGKKNPSSETQCQACSAPLAHEVAAPKKLNDQGPPSVPPKPSGSTSTAPLRASKPTQQLQAKRDRFESEFQRRQSARPPVRSEDQQPESPRAADVNQPAPIALDPRETLISGPGIQPGAQGGRVEISIELRSNMCLPWAAPEKVECEIRAPNNQPLKMITVDEDGGAGRYRVAYKRALAGAYLVWIRVNGMTAGDSPYRVESFPVVSPSRCTVHGAAIADGVQSGGLLNAIVELRDLAGDRLKGDHPATTVTASLRYGREQLPVEVRNQRDGTWVVAWERARAGDYVARVLVDGEYVAESPFHFTVHPKVDVNRTVCRGGGVESGLQSLEDVSFVVSSFDGSGSPVGVRPTVEVTRDSNSVSVQVELVGDDTFRCSYNRSLAGVYKVSVCIDDKPVPNAPFILEVRAVMDPSLTRISLADEPHECVQGSSKGTALVTLFDLAGQELRGGVSVEEAKLVVRVTQADGVTTEEPYIRAPSDSSSGVYRVRYSRPQHGRYRMQAYVDEVPSGEALLFDVLQQVDISTAFVEGDGTQSCLQSNKSATIRLRANDVAGAPFVFSPDSLHHWSVSIKGPGSVSIVPTLTSAIGDPVWSFERVHAGLYTYSVLHEGVSIKSGSFTVEQSVDPSRTQVVGQGVQNAQQSMEPCTIMLYCRDIQGVPIQSGSVQADDVQVLVKHLDSGATQNCAVVNHGDGSLSAEYKRDQRGDYEITAHHCGIPLQGSPFRITVTAEANHDSVTCKSDALERGTAKQGETVRLLLTCKDIGGQPLPGQVFSVSLSDDVTAPVKDVGDGSYVCDFPVLRARTYVVNIECGSRHVAQSPYRLVVPQSLCVEHSVIEGVSSLVEQSVAPGQITVTLYDKAREQMAVGGHAVVAQFGDSLDFPSIRDCADGRYEVACPRTTPGPCSLTVSVDGIELAPVLYSVTQKADRRRTVLATAPLAQGTRQGDTLRWVVTTQDVTGGLMTSGGENIRLELRGPHSVHQRNLICDEGNGSYKAEFVTEFAGLYTVSIKHGDVEVAVQDIVVSQVASAERSTFTLHSDTFAQGRALVQVAQIEARDVMGDDWTGALEEFGLQVPEEYSVSSVGRTGCISLATTLLEAGEHILMATVNGQLLPVESFVVQQVLDPAATQCDDLGFSEGPQSRDPVSAIVLLVDLAGQPFLAERDLHVVIESPSGPVRSVMESGQDGSYRVTFLRLYAGNYSVRITSAQEEGATLLERSFLVTQQPDPLQCLVIGEGLENGIFARRQAHFLVEMRDLQGLAISGRLGKVVVNILGGKTGVIEAAVHDNGDGTYKVTWEPDQHGDYEVGVLYAGMHLASSPYHVQVHKPPTAGSQWQQKFNVESEERKKQREQERLLEIEQAKANFIEHAKKSQAAAKAKEADEIAENKRLRDIDEHMERMRSEEGDAVRKQVLEKLAQQVVEKEFEPVREGEEDAKSGKAWAVRQQKEVEERERARQAEREAEIEAAKRNYLEHAAEAVVHAKTKEEREREEQERLRKIEEHQRELSRQRGYVKPEARPVVPIERDGAASSNSAGEGGGGGSAVPETNGVVLKYEDIVGRKAHYLHNSDGIDCSRLESYMDDSEFETIFGMSKTDFYSKPQWQRAKMLKAKNLF